MEFTSYFQISSSKDNYHCSNAEFFFKISKPKTDCCLTTLLCLLGGGGGESAFVVLWGFATSFYRQSSSSTCCYAGGIPPQTQGRQRGVYLWATEEMLCSMFGSATKGAEW